MKKNIIEIMKYSAIILLSFIAITIVSTSILFLCHISITTNNILLSVILTILFVKLIYGKADKIKLLISSILSVVVMIVFIFIRNTYI